MVTSIIPYFVPIPGLGLAFVTSRGIEVVEVSGGRSALAAAAAYISYRCGARIPPAVIPTHLQLDDALERCLASLSSTTEFDSDPSPPFGPNNGLKMESRLLTEQSEDNVVLGPVVEELQRRGFILTTRSLKSGIARLAWKAPMPVREVIRSVDGSVLGEGKGLTALQRDMSAVGEAVERLLGARPQTRSNLRLANATELDGIVPDASALGLGPRDFVFDGLLTDWIPAWRDDGEPGWLPAELVYTSYVSRSRVCAVGYRNTTGLAAGTSLNDALLHGVLEVIERDAYWTAMRIKRGVDLLDLEQIPGISSDCVDLVIALSKERIRVHLTTLHAAIGIPVMHAVLEHTDGNLPSFSHGSGAALSWAHAAERAITEAVQMRSDQAKVLAAKLDRFIVDGEQPREPMLAWSDPLWAPNINFLMDGPRAAPIVDITLSLADVLEMLRSKGHRVFWVHLGGVANWVALRVVITGMIQPDPKLERSLPQLQDLARVWDLPGLFTDAILS